MRVFHKSGAELALNPHSLKLYSSFHGALLLPDVRQGWPLMEPWMISFSHWPDGREAPADIGIYWLYRIALHISFFMVPRKGQLIVVQFSAWKQKSSNFSPERERMTLKVAVGSLLLVFFPGKEAHPWLCSAGWSPAWRSRTAPALHPLREPAKPSIWCKRADVGTEWDQCAQP